MAELPLTVLLVSVAVVALMPPPLLPATLRRIVLSVMVSTELRREDGAAGCAGDVAGHRRSDHLDVPGCREGVRSNTAAVFDARFPTTAQSRTTRSAKPTRMPPPSPITSPPVASPLRTVNPCNDDLDRAWAGAQHVEHPIFLLGIDDGCARTGPSDGDRIGDVEVAGGIGVLARTGEVILNTPAGRTMVSAPGVGVGLGDGLAKRELAVGRRHLIEGGVHREGGRRRPIFQVFQVKARAAASRAGCES